MTPESPKLARNLNFSKVAQFQHYYVYRVNQYQGKRKLPLKNAREQNMKI
jgi:hypothetical protein